MEAGEEYPRAIRENLERAEVLVAVIGPHWLDLTEPETGSPLIRRRNDWVRWEIAWAFQRNLPVVPVRLIDTPASRAGRPVVVQDDLHHSLQTVVRLTVGLAEQPAAVADPWGLAADWWA